MDVTIIPNVGVIMIECILAVVFYYLLLARGVKRSKKPLIVILGIILAFTTLTLLQVYQIYLNPLGPPPEIWEEWYYDVLYIRTMTYQRALFESLLFLLLSMSFVFATILQSDDDKSPICP